MKDAAKKVSFLQSLYNACRKIMNAGAFFGLLLMALDPDLGKDQLYLAVKEAAVTPIFGIYLTYLIVGLFLSNSILSYLGKHYLDLIFFIPLLTMSFGGVHPAHILLVRQLVHYFDHYYNSHSFRNLASSISRKPARLFAFSFIGISLIGAFILVLPVSVAPGHQPSLLTAVFTSTSAVCVTGLIVEDTGTYFSFFGQIVILILIQIGGLGIMTMSAGVSMLVGRKMALSQSNVMQNVLDQSDFISLKQTLKDIFFWTFAIELTGAIILSARFYVLMKLGLFQSLFLGFFHSISAFCNAGFSVFADSFVSLALDPIINLTIMALIILGGIGFTVIGALNGFVMGFNRRRLACHVHLVVITTIFLIVLGTIVIFALEYQSPELNGMNFQQKILVSLFQSVTTRTAGFNTVDFAKLSSSTLFFMCLLMFIGASPGSTGGGIKTTTLATILLFLDATMRGKSQVTFKGRSISYDTVLKAFLVTAISAGLVFIYSFLLILLEDKPLINLMFEAFSAFATVGLSTGITGSLCAASKILIITLMFIGRIGPLTMALSIRTQSNTGKFSYPETKLLVG